MKPAPWGCAQLHPTLPGAPAARCISSRQYNYGGPAPAGTPRTPAPSLGLPGAGQSRAGTAGAGAGEEDGAALLQLLKASNFSVLPPGMARAVSAGRCSPLRQCHRPLLNARLRATGAESCHENCVRKRKIEINHNSSRGQPGPCRGSRWAGSASRALPRRQELASSGKTAMEGLL